MVSKTIKTCHLIFLFVCLTSANSDAYIWHWASNKVDKQVGNHQMPDKPLELNLKAKAMVSERRFSLSDIATCQGDSFECLDVMSLDLGESPRPGFVTNLKKQTVKDLILSRLQGQRVQLKGASHVSVKREYISVNAEVFKDVINRYLVNKDTESIRYRVDQLFTKPYKLASNYRSLVVNRHDLDLPRTKKNVLSNFNKVSFWVTVYDERGNDLGDDVQVVSRLQILHKVLVSRKYIKRGDLLSESNLHWQWEVYRPVLRNQYVQNFENNKAFQDIDEGMTLYKKMIKKNIAVQRGQLINMSIGSNQLKVSVKGKTLGEGSEGDIIDVLALSTKKIIRAKIVNSSLVALYE